MFQIRVLTELPLIKQSSLFVFFAKAFGHKYFQSHFIMFGQLFAKASVEWVLPLYFGPVFLYLVVITQWKLYLNWKSEKKVNLVREIENFGLVTTLLGDWPHRWIALFKSDPIHIQHARLFLVVLQLTVVTKSQNLVTFGLTLVDLS